MSGRDFRMQYIFGGSSRELKLSIALALVSGTALSALAAVPGVDAARDTAVLVGGLTAPELLALVAITALTLAGYCVKVMVGQNAKSQMRA